MSNVHLGHLIDLDVGVDLADEPQAYVETGRAADEEERAGDHRCVGEIQNSGSEEDRVHLLEKEKH